MIALHGPPAAGADKCYFHRGARASTVGVGVGGRPRKLCKDENVETYCKNFTSHTNYKSDILAPTPPKLTKQLTTQLCNPVPGNAPCSSTHSLPRIEPRRSASFCGKAVARPAPRVGAAPTRCRHHRRPASGSSLPATSRWTHQHHHPYASTGTTDTETSPRRTEKKRKI